MDEELRAGAPVEARCMAAAERFLPLVIVSGGVVSEAARKPKSVVRLSAVEAAAGAYLRAWMGAAARDFVFVSWACVRVALSTHLDGAARRWR